MKVIGIQLVQDRHVPEEDAVRHEAEPGEGSQREDALWEPDAAEDGWEHKADREERPQVVQQAGGVRGIEHRSGSDRPRVDDRADERGCRGGPPERWMKAHEPRESGCRVAMCGDGADNGERHPDREPVERAGQGVREVEVPSEDQLAKGERPERQQEESRELDPQDALGTTAGAEPVEQGGVERQRQVERHLGGKAPPDNQAAEDRVLVERLGEPVEDGRSRPEHVAQPRVDRRNRQGDPEGRHDPEQPPPGEAAASDPSTATQTATDERPVE
ncbi:MAG: hypothetical protein ABI927_06610, partial [Gaiellaceae bacterium]